MCDEIDAAAELEILNVEIALKNRQRPAIEFTGQCHYCEETISKGHYCSAECRQDDERARWAAKQRSVA